MPEKLSQGPRIGYDSRVGAGLSRGPNTKKTMVAAAWSGTWPAPGATLDLDFANDRGFVRGLGQGGVMDGITFTRASNGTFVGEDGLLQFSGGNGRNLLTFPQDFDNAAWGKTGATIIANAEIAPDGTISADALVPTALDSRNIRSPSTLFSVSSFPYSLTWYAKANSLDQLNLYIRRGVNDRTYGPYNLTSVSVTPSGEPSIVSNLAIEDVGNGWCKLSALLNDTNITAFGFGANGSAGVNGLNNLFIWGAQLELGSTATPYYPTNIGVPRFDWAGTEQVASNGIQYSEQFSLWSASSMTATEDQIAAPDGTLTADLINESGNTSHSMSRAYSAVAGQIYTFSCHFKNNNRRYAVLGSGNFNNFIATFDLLTGTTATAFAGVQAGMSDIGDGWWRCWMTFRATTNVSSIFRVGVNNSNSGSIQEYVSQGLSVYAWGAQLDLGAEMTPYKRTGAFTTTNTPLRPAETCNGLLIEEARTNRLLWCRDATQTNWTKTDITAAKDQTGIDGVANAASSLTATADAGTCIQTITLASGSRTGSVYLKRLTGTGVVQVSLDGSTWSTVELSDTEWRRIVLSGTVTNPVVGVRIAVSGDAVAMDFGQVEDGAFVTSPILTTGASATRSADVQSIGGEAFMSFYKSQEFTSYHESTIFAATTRNTLVSYVGNRCQFKIDGINPALIVISNGPTNTISIVGANLPLLTSNKTAFSLGERYDFAIAANGVFSGIGVTISPFFATSLSIGTYSTEQFSGYIKRIVHLNQTVSKDGLLEMTRP
jgi:hypothetical protein